MLKKIHIKSSEISVPIPISTLGEAVKWAKETLLNEGSVITDIILDGKSINLDCESDDISSLPLSHENILKLTLDNPRDISVQTVEVIGNLAFTVICQLKPVAVKTWDLENGCENKQIKNIICDLDMLINLIDHLNGILDYSHDLLSPINGNYHLLKSSLKKVKVLNSKMEWKELSEVLLNRIDLQLKYISRECDLLQILMLTDDSNNLILNEHKKWIEK